jgi:hypothetical protein
MASLPEVTEDDVQEARKALRKALESTHAPQDLIQLVDNVEVDLHEGADPVATEPETPNVVDPVVRRVSRVRRRSGS